MAKIKINKIERSKRKTIALLVNTDSTLTIRAPFLTPTRNIDRIIEKKQMWIRRKIKEVELRPKATVREFVNGEGFLLLGKPHRLKIGNFASIHLGDYLFFPKSQKENIQEHLTEWYKQQALKKITSRVNWYAKKMGVEYTSLRLSNANKRWGSCGQNNTLSLNWRLIMAPLKTIDYVVVHELVHVTEKSHSKKFWNKVRTVLVDYEKSRAWLKNNGHLLNV